MQRTAVQSKTKYVTAVRGRTAVTCTMVCTECVLSVAAIVYITVSSDQSLISLNQLQSVRELRGMLSDCASACCHVQYSCPDDAARCRPRHPRSKSQPIRARPPGPPLATHWTAPGPRARRPRPCHGPATASGHSTYDEGVWCGAWLPLTILMHFDTLHAVRVPLSASRLVD